MKNKYVPTAAGLYLNYLIHGMGVLLITLNMGDNDRYAGFICSPLFLKMGHVEGD
jgi:hypothetical protein